MAIIRHICDDRPGILVPGQINGHQPTDIFCLVIQAMRTEETSDAALLLLSIRINCAAVLSVVIFIRDVYSELIITGLDHLEFPA